VRVCAFALLAACSHSHAHEGPDAPDLVDSPIVKMDAPPPPCMTPVAGDTFDTGPPCESWGYAFIDDAGGMIMVRNSQLVIAPGANAAAGASHIGCATTMAVDFTLGAFVEVDQPITSTEYLDFYAGAEVVEFHPMKLLAFHNNFDGTMVGLTDTDLAKWVRIIASPDQMSVLIQASNDGLDWNTFATDPVTPPATASIEIDGGTKMPDTAPPPILVDGLDVCPVL
jgi:hypothetical protein